MNKKQHKKDVERTEEMKHQKQTECVCLCAGDVQQVEGAEKITVKIFKSITLIHDAGMVLLEVRGSDVLPESTKI